MFCSQRPAEVNEQLIAETGPMVYIAHAMTPFSPKDVTVYSNCEEVRLTYCKGGKEFTYKKRPSTEGMPSPVITFTNVWDVMYDKQLSRKKKQNESYLLAEGLINGRVVATHKVTPSRRPSKLLLWVDNEQMETTADGSDLVTVVAAVADGNGIIKRLNNYYIRFEVEGPAQLVGNVETYTNPRPVQWGTAPILLRATTTPGRVKVRAFVTMEGKHMPLSAELNIETRAAAHPLVAAGEEIEEMRKQTVSDMQSRQTLITDCEKRIQMLQQELNRLKLREVEKQQSDFE